MLADIISILLLCSFVHSQTEETSKSRHKPPPLHIPRNTNPSVFTFSPTSTSSQSPSPAPFTPSFLNSLNDLQNSTPRSPNQVPSRAQRHHSQTTPVISRRQRSFTSASSNSRQTTPSTPSTSSFRHPSASFTSISSSKRSRTPASASREHQRCCKELINNVHQFNRVQFAVLFGTLLD